jgi:hypothetical protein
VEIQGVPTKMMGLKRQPNTLSTPTHPSLEEYMRKTGSNHNLDVAMDKMMKEAKWKR